MHTRIKNCGMKTADAIDAAVRSGVDFIGFIIHPSSPRHISPKAAADLARSLPSQVQSVAVLVNPTNETMADLLSVWRPDIIQLHGDESPLRASSIRSHTCLPIIKAIPVATGSDVKRVKEFSQVADYALFDTKTPEHGGSGQSFDWTLLQGTPMPLPWFLSGGLNTDNVAEALRLTKAPMVDVCSGIESARGIKDHAKIAAFNDIVRRFRH